MSDDRLAISVTICSSVPAAAVTLGDEHTDRHTGQAWVRIVLWTARINPGLVIGGGCCGHG
jgi:hypothetical protein